MRADASYACASMVSGESKRCSKELYSAQSCSCYQSHLAIRVLFSPKNSICGCLYGTNVSMPLKNLCTSP